MKIGVFVCDCGTNIAAVVDVPAVCEFAGTLDDVVLADEGKWICSVDYLDSLKNFITENNLDRVVVACCTPRTHEAIFRSALEEAGLNPNLLEFCSIREHVSWVHKDSPAEATAKAKDLVEMAVAKARLLKPADAIKMPVGIRSMVVGGGIAGMTTALTLAMHGFEVVLVERQDKLGGLLNDHSVLAPTDRPAAEVLGPLHKQIEDNKLITVKTNTELSDVSGYVGNFKATLRSSRGLEEAEVSTIILATGMRVLEPVGLCGYGKSPKVVTQLEFEKMLKNGKLDGIGTVAFINCVNSRNDERGCCNVGCVTSMKHIKSLKAKKPDSKAFLFYRDLIVPGTESEYCDAIQPEADALIRYAAGALPAVSEAEGGRLNVRAHDLLLEEDVEVNADIVVLVTAFAGDESASHLKDLLRVTIGNDNFYQEAHVKLRPVDFASDGIYLAGCGRSPKSVSECVSEAMGAAMRASIPMQRGYVESDGLVAEIDAERCIGCEICSVACAYGALEELPAIESKSVSRSVDQPVSLNSDGGSTGARPHGGTGAGGEIPAARPHGGTGVGGKRFSVIEALCKGCGTCVGGCPEHAITMTNFTDEQIVAQVDALLLKEEREKKERAGEEERERVREGERSIVFACHWCALGAADLAGVSRYQYPADARIIRVMCAGRVDPSFVMRAFAQGAPGVMVAGCEVPTCHYISGNIYASWRMEMLHALMDHCHLDRKRLRVEWISASQGDRFAKMMTSFSEDSKGLGPIPMEQIEGLDMKAAAACADSERLRLLVGRLPALESEGNEYGEKLSRHELNRILEQAVADEFVVQKILLQLGKKIMSVRELADEGGVEPPKVLRAVLGLVRESKVKRDRVEDTTPYYTLVKQAPESVGSLETRSIKEGVSDAG